MKAVADFIHNLESELSLQNRPLVTLSYAQSLDGSIARRSGFPLQFSGQESLEMTHHLRAMHDGILVGINTILSDDPQLTVRGVPGPHPRPIILDRALNTPMNARVLEHPNKPWICAGKRERRGKTAQFHHLGCRVFNIINDNHRWLSIKDMLAQLHAAGIRRLMVEGGATVIERFISTMFVDVVVLTIAPVYVGGLKPLRSVLAESSELGDYPNLTSHTVEKLGNDIVICGQFSKP